MDKDIQQTAEILGKRVALLLAIAPISNEQRANLASSVANMTPEQLIQFMQALEGSIPDGMHTVDPTLQDGLQKARDTYAQDMKENMQSTHTALDDLEKMIP